MDERLLAPCTADLLRGWTGPVHGYVHRGIPTRAVCTGDITDPSGARPTPHVILWTQMGDAVARPEDLSLDLSLAECKDRTVRGLLALEGLPDTHAWWYRIGGSGVWALHPAGTCVQYMPSTGGGKRLTYDGWARPVPALADLDLSGDPRTLDALALAAVWREVSRGR